MKVFLLLFFLLFPSFSYAEDFIIIVNRDGPLKDADMGSLREVYLGEKKFAGDTKLRPINFTEGPLKEAFLKTVVNMSLREYKHHHIAKVFQEGSSMPTTMGSPVDIIEFVSKEKGAVAYLPASWTETIKSGVTKVTDKIKIIGHKLEEKDKQEALQPAP
jgi:hypothetical protein